MYNKNYRLSLYLFAAAGLLIFSGCAIEPPKQIEVVPGKSSVTEALSVLKARSEKAVPLLARGRCVFEFYDTESKKRKKEQLAVLVLMQPPIEIYLQGDATLLKKALILGSNEREFWLLLRPNEISTYWWGMWSEQESYEEGLMINPKTLFEALGFLDIESEENWSLSSKGINDILTQRNRGIVIKKMHISKYGYLINKIEYFSSSGKALAMAELKNYKKLAGGFCVPASIKITTYKQEDGAEPLGITFDLATIKPKELSERQQSVFERPPPEGFKHVLRNEGEKWIKENQ